MRHPKGMGVLCRLPVLFGTLFILTGATVLAGCLSPPDPVMDDSCIVALDGLPGDFAPGETVPVVLQVDCDPGVELGARGVLHDTASVEAPTRGAYDASCRPSTDVGRNTYRCGFADDDAVFVRAYQLYSEGGVAKIAWSREYVSAGTPEDVRSSEGPIELRLWNVPSRPTHGSPFEVQVSVGRPVAPPGALSEEIGVLVVDRDVPAARALEVGSKCGSVSGVVPGEHTVRCTIDEAGPKDLRAHAALPTDGHVEVHVGPAVPVQVR